MNYNDKKPINVMVKTVPSVILKEHFACVILMERFVYVILKEQSD